VSPLAWVLLVIAVLLVGAFILMIPELRRYMKMRAM